MTDQKRKALRRRFPGVQAWGNLMGSKQASIDDRLLEAEADNAPRRARYKSVSGEWQTYPFLTEDGDLPFSFYEDVAMYSEKPQLRGGVPWPAPEKT